MANTACFIIVGRNDIPIYEAEVGSAAKVHFLLYFLHYFRGSSTCNSNNESESFDFVVHFPAFLLHSPQIFASMFCWIQISRFPSFNTIGTSLI